MQFSTLLLLSLIVPPLLSAILFYVLPHTTAAVALPQMLRGKRITLLIAHPDDEAMFFAPTLLALAPLKDTIVSVLCLSSGDADGLGSIRKGELVASCRRLGVKRDDDVQVIEHKDLPDSMTITWPAATISQLLSAHASDADVIITFDAHGISSHPNHISLLHGAREFINRGPGKGKKLLTLTTVGIARKYSSILDAPLTKWSGKSGLVFVSTWEQVRIAQRAMTDAHKSQMRWFRWGWIGLSRYMVVNNLEEDDGR